jgi:hypothetical protein
MRCSVCSHPVNPIVAIDVDGTLGDYHGHFLRFASNWLHNDDDAIKLQLEMSLSMYDGTETFSSYCMDIMDIDLATYRLIKLAYRQGGMKRTMPINKWATAVTHFVRACGAELWITTTRPYLSLDNIVPDTVEWLSRHGIVYDHMLFDEDKFAVLANRVDSERVVAVLDDLPEMYDAAGLVLHYGTDVPILIKSVYNAGVRRPLMSDLDATIPIIDLRIKQWREQHDF